MEIYCVFLGVFFFSSPDFMEKWMSTSWMMHLVHYSHFTTNGQRFSHKSIAPKGGKTWDERKSKCHNNKSIKLSPLLMWKSTAVPFMKRERLRGFRCSPKYSVCWCLNALCRLCLSWWTLKLECHQIHFTQKVALVKRIEVIKRWAGFSLPLKSLSTFSPIYLSVPALVWIC